MKKIANLPIQKKMLAITLLICGAVLCFAAVALFVFQVFNFRSSFQRDAETLAVVIANNSTAAMAFKEDNTATEVVGSLQAEPTVLGGNLVWPNGGLFASYGQPETSTSLAEFPPEGKHRFLNGQLLTTQPVKLKGEKIGTLYLRSDYQTTFLALLRVYGLVIFGILFVAIGLAAFLSGRLGRGVTEPILELARTAQIVGDMKDYSVRATVSSGGDELSRLTKSFNDMLGRIQTQDQALNFSQQKMEALVHSIDGIVWERSPETFHFTFISRQSEKILGYPPQLWLTNPNFWYEKLHPDDAVKATQTGRAVVERGLPYSHEYRLVAADGHVVWIRESGTILHEQEKAVAVRGIFHNITQNKLDAEQLDKLNRQLIDTSRSAGMADVATGVLHNVGNVLNSVSVAATLVADRLRRSKIGNLGKAAGMLREQNGHLVEYLTSDPKGKLIPAYIGTVADELAGEQKELIAKMNAVGEHIEHIKEIVAMQQSYAKISGVFENLQPAALVEDALRINATAFDRHHIDLVKDFQRVVPAVCVDRHKVLQILINLLRNAKHAMEERLDQPKRLIVRIKLSGPDRVQITILDNGIGIAEENMNKIFNHGFTTKKDGHGFGLHSGANAAKEIGGSLTAKSGGPGNGAEFTLELPAVSKS